MVGDFRATYRMFKNYLDYTKPYTFEEWNNLPSDLKVSALFVQFYQEIELVWNKYKQTFSDESDGVEIVLQYLNKNVPIIERNSNRFTQAYMYKVCSNCIKAITIRADGNRYRTIYDNEVSNIQTTNSGEEVDLIDRHDKFINTLIKENMTDERCREFWDIIESDEDCINVVCRILDQPRLYGKRRRRVSRKEFNQQVAILREKLSDFRSDFCL